jgi:BirA family transcriptional regulator, biotin operon repressor / biotin---[acetyl-CoA-carboxylase] ligase
LRPPAAGESMTTFVSRLERFAVVGSTNDVVRELLADGTPEVCLAVADEQTAGRGREGRTWTAPAGHALLASLGFRPTWLPPDRVWRLAAIASIAMAEGAESLAGIARGSIRLKWPNDLVVEDRGAVRKLAGVLGETDGLGTGDPRAVVGIGMNADWPVAEFPPDLADTMTSLREIAGRSVDHEALLEAFLERLEPLVEDLRKGQFDGPGWRDRQATTGRDVDLIAPDGTRTTVRATGVDATTGALLADDRPVLVGEIRHVRIAPAQIARSMV